VAVRWLVGCALVGVLGCSAPDRAPSVAAPAPATTGAPRPAAAAVEVPHGIFEVTKDQKVTDNCGTMVWVSTQIDIDASAMTLYATPDKRLYDVAMDGAALVARGLFEPRPQCGNETYTEIWRLEREGPDALSGFVTTYSHFNSADCLHACKAVFAVRVARSRSRSQD
jgi:hypothetical protein